MKKALIHQTPAEKLANNSASTISAIQQNTTEVIKALKANTPDNSELITKLQENKQKLDEVKSATLITNQQGKKSNELLEKIAERKESAVVSFDTGDAEVVTITGDKGEPGKDGKDGLDGKDGVPGMDGLDGKDAVAPTVAEILRHVRVPKDGRDGLDGINGREGTDGSPDTSDEIIEKVNTATKKIEGARVRGFTELERAIANYGSNPSGGVISGGKTVRYLDEGVEASAHVTELNFGTGLTLTYAGDGRVTVSSSASGGNVSKVGTPVDNQVGVWTGDGTIEGDTAFLFDTTANILSIGVENGTGTVKGPNALTVGFQGGRLNLRGGDGLGAGNGGQVNLLGGYGGEVSGLGGHCYFEGGGSDVAAGGSILFVGGVGTTNGSIKFLDPTTTNAAVLDLSALVTADRIISFQNKAGSLALIETNTTLSSIGNNDLILQTGNATTGTITVADGLNGDITIAPNGTGVAQVLNANAEGVGAVLELYQNSASPANADVVGTLSFQGNDSGAAKQEYAKITGAITDVTAASENGKLTFHIMEGGAITSKIEIQGTAMRPTLNDGIALGNTSFQYSDLFLASGAVINFNNGNMTITHSAGLLTLAGGNLALGTGTLTMTGSIAATGARVTKGWFTDIESTNMPTVGGTALLTSLTAPQFTTIELGHATDTTLSRSAAGVLAVEGVVIPSISSTNTLTNKRVTLRTGTTTSSATPTINTDNVDFYSLTAQAADITSFTTNLSGTPTEAQKLQIAITGTAARAITWGASFEASTVALPTTTVTTNRLDVGFVWNTVTSKWRCVASA